MEHGMPPKQREETVDLSAEQVSDLAGHFAFPVLNPICST